MALESVLAAAAEAAAYNEDSPFRSRFITRRFEAAPPGIAPVSTVINPHILAGSAAMVIALLLWLSSISPAGALIASVLTPRKQPRRTR